MQISSALRHGCEEIEMLHLDLSPGFGNLTIDTVLMSQPKLCRKDCMT